MELTYLQKHGELRMGPCSGLPGPATAGFYETERPEAPSHLLSPTDDKEFLGCLLCSFSRPQFT